MRGFGNLVNEVKKVQLLSQKQKREVFLKTKKVDHGEENNFEMEQLR